MVLCVYKLWIIKSLENRCVLVTLSANKKTQKSMQLYYVKYCSSANWSSYMCILSLTSSHTFWYQHGHVWKNFSNPMSPHPGSGTYVTWHMRLSVYIHRHALHMRDIVCDYVTVCECTCKCVCVCVCVYKWIIFWSILHIRTYHTLNGWILNCSVN